MIPLRSCCCCWLLCPVSQHRLVAKILDWALLLQMDSPLASHAMIMWSFSFKGRQTTGHYSMAIYQSSQGKEQQTKMPEQTEKSLCIVAGKSDVGSQKSLPSASNWWHSDELRHWGHGNDIVPDSPLPACSAIPSAKARLWHRHPPQENPGTRSVAANPLSISGPPSARSLVLRHPTHPRSHLRRNRD